MVQIPLISVASFLVEIWHLLVLLQCTRRSSCEKTVCSHHWEWFGCSNPCVAYCVGWHFAACCIGWDPVRNDKSYRIAEWVRPTNSYKIVFADQHFPKTSCGQCGFCLQGNAKLYRLMHATCRLVQVCASACRSAQINADICRPMPISAD